MLRTRYLSLDLVLFRSQLIQYLPHTVLVQGESFCMGTSHVHCKSDSSDVAHAVLIYGLRL